MNKTYDMAAISSDAILPPISLTRRDHQKLTSLAAASPHHGDAVRDFLADELARASILEGHEAPGSLVTMHARILFRDDRTGRTSEVELAYPEEADIAAGRISVLTPIGAALIGLSEGQSINWETRAGVWKSLTVLRVISPSRN